MSIETAQEQDLPELLHIYARARELMRQSGNPTQWGDSWPSEEVLQRDLSEGILYRIRRKGSIVGAFAFGVGPYPPYEAIQGAWLDQSPYGVIHRLAGDGRERGLFDECLSFCRERVGSIKIDTHPDNAIMRRLIEKNGFVRCGGILSESGTPRIAYQWKKEGCGHGIRQDPEG